MSIERVDDPELSVRLPQSTWLTVIESLGQRPYAEVATVLEGIAEQLNAQARAAAARLAPELRAN